ncbi:hypothetical protein HYU11_03485 [Candidatus Woesearchaeota archaeon]|nr:hypothetical protein [Candidatus Woesearchaeota archaeon]
MARKIGISHVFLLTAIALLIFLASKSANSDINMEKQAIIDNFVASENNQKDLAFVIDGQVDREKLEAVAEIPYDELKSRIGIKRDFMIYFIDEGYQPVPIRGRRCIGMPGQIDCPACKTLEVEC